MLSIKRSQSVLVHNVQIKQLNNIVVNYVVTSDQIAKTKTEFDKLTDAEKKAVDETKKLNDQLKKTGQEGGKSVKGVGSPMY